MSQYMVRAPANAAGGQQGGLDGQVEQEWRREREALFQEANIARQLRNVVAEVPMQPPMPVQWDAVADNMSDFTWMSVRMPAQEQPQWSQEPPQGQPFGLPSFDEQAQRLPPSPQHLQRPQQHAPMFDTRPGASDNASLPQRPPPAVGNWSHIDAEQLQHQPHMMLPQQQQHLWQRRQFSQSQPPQKPGPTGFQQFSEIPEHTLLAPLTSGWADHNNETGSVPYYAAPPSNSCVNMQRIFDDDRQSELNEKTGGWIRSQDAKKGFDDDTAWKPPTKGKRLSFEVASQQRRSLIEGYCQQNLATGPMYPQKELPRQDQQQAYRQQNGGQIAPGTKQDRSRNTQSRKGAKPQMSQPLMPQPFAGTGEAPMRDMYPTAQLDGRKGGNMGRSNLSRGGQKPRRMLQVAQRDQESSALSGAAGALAAAGTMKSQLQALQSENSECIFIARRINKLGFASADRLRAHFCRYGEVKGVYVSHSRVRCRYPNDNQRPTSGEEWRLRAAALGFVVMVTPVATGRVLAAGPDHNIGGCQISVQPFRRQTSAEGDSDEECDDLPATIAKYGPAGGTGGLAFNPFPLAYFSEQDLANATPDFYED